MNDLVSVIIPVYNIDEYVGECLESIVNQTYKNLEIIVVNDGSTDNSKTICDDYARMDSRIIIIDKPNGGLVSARKAGITKSKGSYICCVDGDDWVEPNYVENMYREICETNIDIVIAGFKRNLDGISVEILNNIDVGDYSRDNICDKIGPRLINYGVFFEFGIYSYLWNKLFRRSSILEFQMAVPDQVFIGEDSACVYPTIFNSNRIKIIDKTDYNYRQRPNSMLKKEPDFERELEAFAILYNHLNKILTFDSNPKLSDILNKQITELIVGLMIIRTGGYIKYEGKILFSLFNEIDFSKNIAVYSAGTFGQHVYRRLKYNFNIKNLCWYDPDYIQYTKHGLEVCNPIDISKKKYDYIIICSLSITYVEEISKLLIRDGFKEKNIISIKTSNIDLRKIIKCLKGENYENSR